MEGYFPSDGVARRVGRELVMLLGGGRALLLQLAHPLLAAGVATHSDYRRDPWRRLEGTMSAVWSVVFGSVEEADAVAARVRTMHRRVHGTIAEASGVFPAGTPYSALDPELLLWVHATLVDTALLVYQAWVAPLSERDQARYWDEMKTMARLFGTPDAVIPQTLGDFRAYMRERLASEEICVTDTARDVARSVLNPPLPVPLRPLMRSVEIVTAGMLPVRLRVGYGFGWGPARAALLAASRESVRRIAMPLLPDIVRAPAPARRSERARLQPEGRRYAARR
jgi:uncharacterized protein (DUF2236 family)